MKEFQLTDLSSSELDARLAAAATSYGVGTKSYNSSSEKKELDRQKKAVTAKYEASPRHEFVIGPICNCRSYCFPQDPCLTM